MILRKHNYLLISLIGLVCITQSAKAITQKVKALKKDSILVIYPIVETRLQVTKDRYEKDNEAYLLADSLTNKALRKLLDGVGHVKYEGLGITNPGWAVTLDTLLSKARDYKYNEFSNEALVGSTIILVPYLIWTRTTEDFDKEKCSKGAGRTYISNDICTWTRVQTFLFLIDRNSNRILYYNYHHYASGYAYLPYEQRVTKSFEKCLRPLLRKMRKGDKMKR